MSNRYQFKKSIESESGLPPELPISGWYPINRKVQKLLKCPKKLNRFNAMCFAGFLHDTYYVENQLVNPVASNLNRLTFPIPHNIRKDMAIVMVEEAEHALISLDLVNRLQEIYDFKVFEDDLEEPLFIRKINDLGSQLENNSDYFDFMCVMACITETRISRELGVFVKDKSLNTVVKDVCKDHQEEEVYHDSLFRALAHLAWQQSPKEKRWKMANWYAKGMIARSEPDVQRLAFYLQQVTNWSPEVCRKHIKRIFCKQYIKREVVFAASPTIKLLKSLGVLELGNAYKILEQWGFKLPGKRGEPSLS